MSTGLLICPCQRQGLLKMTSYIVVVHSQEKIIAAAFFEWRTERISLEEFSYIVKQISCKFPVIIISPYCHRDPIHLGILKQLTETEREKYFGHYGILKVCKLD